MNYNKIEYECECCHKKFTTGAIIPNKTENKKIALCEECYTELEIYTLIHIPITKWIEEIQKIKKEKELSQKQDSKKEAE